MKLGDEEKDIVDYDRVVAIIYHEGKVYESDRDHQSCLEDMQKEVFRSRGWDLSVPEHHAKAIDFTDEAFRENRLFGFDLMQNLEEGYVVAHYPQNLENEDCMKAMRFYAEANDLELATYLERDKLGSKFRVVL